MQNMLVRIDSLTTNTVRDQNRVLRQALRQAFLFIAHDQANRGQLTDDLQWNNNVVEFLKGPVAQIDIGRSYTPKAVLEINKIKALLTMPEPTYTKERSLLDALLSLDQDDLQQIMASDADTRMHVLARLSRLADVLSSNSSAR